jgi:hypothetical protein
MFYTTPPPPPLPVPIYRGDDCEKGSRDCFPENTQGGAIQERDMILFNRDLSDISLLATTHGPDYV